MSAAVAAALMSAPGPAAASKIAQLYRDSQAEESLFEKIIRERGDKLPSISIPRSAPAPKSEGKEEGEVYVLPKQVELVDIPLKLSEPVRSTIVAPPSRVPEPEPAKKASVAQEGVVKITGGDLPAPPPGKAREAPKEAPKLPFSFPAPSVPTPPPAPLAKVEEAAKAEPSPAAEAPKPFGGFFSAPKAEEAPSVPTLPTPPPAPVAKVEEAAKAEPAPAAEAPKPFGGFFTKPGEETKPDPAESKGEAGKPELPQQEPSVTPGSSITIPEAKNIAPEPKVEAPKPATKEPAAGDDNPFAIFSQSATPAPQKAPAQKVVQPEKPQLSQDGTAGGSGLPVWVGVGGSIAVAVAAFVANGKNQTEVREAEQKAQEATQAAAESTAEVAKDLEPSSAKGGKEE
ncbi:hypothetical protein WJX75_009590 [Coccomyxa subellipsoidea]|uniref:Uncharacterized protein n=1 Tax=Coccomyxa subellipsoidea TaxID=248742 RepID=A0ABR2YUV8_9CHLO